MLPLIIVIGVFHLADDSVHWNCGKTPLLLLLTFSIGYRIVRVCNVQASPFFFSSMYFKRAHGNLFFKVLISFFDYPIQVGEMNHIRYLDFCFTALWSYTLEAAQYGAIEFFQAAYARILSMIKNQFIRKMPNNGNYSNTPSRSNVERRAYNIVHYMRTCNYSFVYSDRFVLRNYGISGIQNYIRSHIRLAKRFERHVVKDRRFEICNEVKVNESNILHSYSPNNSHDYFL